MTSVWQAVELPASDWPPVPGQPVVVPQLFSDPSFSS